MNISADDFRKHFALLSDEALLETNPGDLVALARTCLDEEIASRGLNAAGGETETEAVEGVVETEPDKDEEEGLVSIASYTVADEARMARGLLQIAEIPAFLANESAALGALHLMVPASMVAAALEVLSEEMSEEELAAQAEAAGYEYEDGEAAESEDEAGSSPAP
jgi:hypothetical protein